MEFTYGYPSPLGKIMMASDGHSLTGLWFEGQKHFAAGLDRGHTEKSLPVFDETALWLDLYFRGTAPPFTPPLLFRTSQFRETVWQILLGIPYGETTTYGAIARQAAAELAVPRMSARAVGGAVAHNPISIIVPCHRVLGARYELGDYAGGIERKVALLQLEGAF